MTTAEQPLLPPPVDAGVATPDDGDELSADALEAVAGGGLYEAYAYVRDKVQQAGQQLLDAANGGGGNVQ